MGQNFIACDREQVFLMPPDVRAWLPESHLAWFVVDAVEEMDPAAFTRPIGPMRMGVAPTSWGSSAEDRRRLSLRTSSAASLAARERPAAPARVARDRGSPPATAIGTSTSGARHVKRSEALRFEACCCDSARR